MNINQVRGNENLMRMPYPQGNYFVGQSLGNSPFLYGSNIGNQAVS